MKKNTNKNFLSPLFKVFSEINFEFSFKNLGYLPRWLILLFDLSIVIFSFFVTYILFQGLKLNYIPNKDHILYVGVFYLLLNAFFFWLYRTYSGIIRHSSHIDALKLFFSQFSAFVVIILLNTILLVFNEQKIFLTTGVFINAVLTFCLLFFYRIIVKQTFDRIFFNPNSKRRINAIIYGSDANAIAVANALTSERPARFRLLGFIDKNNENLTKRILDLPIIPIKRTLPVLMRLMKVEALILADNSLSKDEKLAIVDECIEYNFKVFTLPVVSDWEDQKEISKKIKSFEIHDLLERKPIVLDTRSIALKVNNKVILVSGAAGSIGSEIVRQILNFNPTRIIILDQAETPLHSLSLEIQSLGRSIQVHNVIADIRNYESLDRIFNHYKPDLVYHAAAYKHVPMMEENPSQAIFTNVLGTKNLADLSQKYHVERFVMISTDKAVNPSSVMGASKRIAEMYVQSKHFKHKRIGTENHTKFITTRFGNVLGSNGSVVPLFTKQIQEGYIPILAHPERYNFYHNSLNDYKRLKTSGCKFQINMLSTVGYYGPHVAKAADYLIGNNLIDFIGSDVHHNRHVEFLKNKIILKNHQCLPSIFQNNSFF